MIIFNIFLSLRRDFLSFIFIKLNVGISLLMGSKVKMQIFPFAFKFFFEILKNISAILEFEDLKLWDIGGLNIIIKAGKNRKVENNEKIKPIVIIQPKSITGLISLNTSDKKAQIVVRTA